MKLHSEIETLEKKLQDLQSQTTHIADVGGDQWHDNAAYETLVIDIRGVDRLLTNAHQVLNRATLVEPPATLDRVAIGVRVKLMRDGGETVWEIVGFGESDPDKGMLAYNAPLASLIIGKRKGDTVSGLVTGKQTRIEILDIMRGGEYVGGS